MIGLVEEEFFDPSGRSREEGERIGWDFGRFSMELPDDVPDYVINSAKAARYHFGRQRKHHDRYIRKWLRLRLNAWKRNRIVCPNVDPGFLQQIDVEYCPVTRTVLAHGDGGEQNWSVDRVNNDGGYARGNLAVMSTAANKAKGCLSPAEVMEIALRPEGALGLGQQEWLRMAALCNFVDHSGPRDAWRLTPLLVVPPPCLAIRCGSVVVQTLSSFSAARTSSRGHAALMSACKGKSQRKAMDAYLKLLYGLAMARLKRPSPGRSMVELMWAAEDIWSDGGSHLMRIWAKFIETVGSDAELDRFIHAMRGVGPAPSSGDVSLQEWGLNTNGYTVESQIWKTQERLDRLDERLRAVVA